MSIITTTYGQKALVMLQTDPAQAGLWNGHPVKLSEIEKAMFNFARVISILANESSSPSQSAEIQMDLIASDLIRRLDRTYQNAMRAYKEKLIEAQEKDLSSIRANKDFWIYENCPGFAWAIQLLGASFISQDQYESAARAYRFAWLIEVSVLEEERLTALKSQIESELILLSEDLEDLAKHNQTDVDLLKQAKQLKVIYKAHFPTASLAQDAMLERLFQEALPFMSQEKI